MKAEDRHRDDRHRDGRVRRWVARFREDRTPWSPWALGGLSVRELAARVVDDVWKHAVLDRAGALSYFFLLALFPGLIFLAALFGLLPVEGLMDRLLSYLEPVVPAGVATLIESVLNEVVAGASGRVLSLGAIGALWSASIGMLSVMTVLNEAYGVDDQRPWWKRRLIAIALTLGFSVFVAVALVLLVIGPPVVHAMAGSVGLGLLFSLLWELVSWPVVIVLAITAVDLVYYLAPAARHPWRWLTPGSVFAVAGWVLMSSLLRLYIAWFGSFNKTYGSLGGAVLLLLWLYLGSVALLIGAEVDSEITEATAERAAERQRVQERGVPRYAGL
jgi:membrane protein